MGFNRQASGHLRQWKNDSVNRKPLIIRGARQVGKTTLVRDFAKTYNQSILLNLEKPFDRAFFEDLEDVKSIAEALFLFHNIPSEKAGETLLFLDQRIKFQGFGNSNYRSREVGECFRILEDARILRLIYPTTDLKPPVQADLKKSPRVQLLDTGLVNYTLGIQGQLLSLEDLSSAYKGSLIPHLTGQELISTQTLSDRKPNFWVREKRQTSAEVDLVFAWQNKIIPIEIKSGATGSLRSLHQFIEASDHPYAVRVYGGGFKVEETQTPQGKPYLLMNLPYYLGTKIGEYVKWFTINH
jgi:predicted AAA+ superfamily ATPase